MRRGANVDSKRFNYFDQQHGNSWLHYLLLAIFPILTILLLLFFAKIIYKSYMSKYWQKEMDAKRSDGSELQINDRVASEGHYGSVKFIGTLPDTKGK